MNSSDCPGPELACNGHILHVLRAALRGNGDFLDLIDAGGIGGMRR
jgi:hypothetical protein